MCADLSSVLKSPTLAAAKQVYEAELLPVLLYRHHGNVIDAVLATS